MLLYHLTNHNLIHKDNLTTHIMASLTLVLVNLITSLSSPFILIKGTNNLLKSSQHLQFKKFQDKVSLVMNTINLSKIDKCLIYLKFLY